MEHYRLRRLGQVDLEFDGTLLAGDSSNEPGKDRWTEVRIYQTTSDKWVTEVKGCTTVEGEANRYRASVCETPEQVVTSFRQWSRKKKTWYLTNIVLDVLDSAAEVDPRLSVALKEKV